MCTHTASAKIDMPSRLSVHVRLSSPALGGVQIIPGSDLLRTISGIQSLNVPAVLEEGRHAILAFWTP